MKKIFLTIIFLLISLPALCSTLTLEWERDDSADYYVVYWGTTSVEYTNKSDQIDVNNTQYTVLNLSEDYTYYFAVKAFNNCGNASDFSDEVVKYPSTSICFHDLKVTGVIITDAK